MLWWVIRAFSNDEVAKKLYQVTLLFALPWAGRPKFGSRKCSIYHLDVECNWKYIKICTWYLVETYFIYFWTHLLLRQLMLTRKRPPICTALRVDRIEQTVKAFTSASYHFTVGIDAAATLWIVTHDGKTVELNVLKHIGESGWGYLTCNDIFRCPPSKWWESHR